MSNLKSRVKRLEEQTAPAWQGHQPGVRTVKFEPFDWRKSGMMKYDRFVIMRVNRAALVIVRDEEGRFLHFLPRPEKEKEMDALKERLRQEFLIHPEWSREEKNEKAKRHGFRVIYPDSPDSEALWT